MTMPEELTALALQAEAMQREVAAIIPAYRCAQYLGAAVDSLLDTSIEEILIAVDGGDRESLRVAEDYRERAPGRIRVIAQRERFGAAGNVNRAVRQTDRPFFLKLDGDDILLPDFVTAALPKICNTPELALVSGYGLRFTNLPSMTVRFLPDYTDEITVLQGTDAYRFIIEWSPNPSSSGTIYRRDAFLEVGGYDEQLVWGEDWEIWLRLAKRWSVAYVPVPASLYRIHGESTTATVTSQNRLSDGYDAVFRQALRLSPRREMRLLLRRKFIKVARAHLGAARRSALKSGSRSESVRHIGRALKAGWTVVAL